MLHGGSRALVSAEIDCFVDLDPAQKGVHMSRFPELFEEAIDEAHRREAARRAAGRAHRPPHRRAPACAPRRGADRGALPDRAAHAGDRAAHAGARHARRHRRGDARRARGASSASRRPGSTPARARRAWCGSSAAERLARGGLRGRGRRADPRARPARDAQPARPRASCTSAPSCASDAEELVDIVERSMSSPIYELLKRPDELFVVEHAHLQPRFVEDSVRVMVQARARRVPAARRGRLRARAPGQLRDDPQPRRAGRALRGRGRAASRSSPTGEPTGRHTELRDWLRAQP